MADLVSPLLKQYVTDLFKEDSKLFEGVEDKVGSLEAELQLINISLKNSEAKPKDEFEEELIRQMSDVAFEAEDVIDGFRTEVTKYSRMGWFKSLFYSHAHASALGYFGKKTVAIKEKTNEIFNNKRKYGILIDENKWKRQRLAQQANLEASSSTSQPAFSSQEVLTKIAQLTEGMDRLRLEMESGFNRLNDKLNQLADALAAETARRMEVDRRRAESMETFISDLRASLLAR